jgi:AcrR family transcriptional regulator
MVTRWKGVGMPRGFTDQEKKNIQARLLKTGKDSFGQFGIRKTSVEDLARLSGISKGAFYQFFSSKEDLYFAVLRSYESEQHKNMFAILSSESENERELLKSVMKEIMLQVDDDPFVRRLLGKDEFDYLWQKFTPEQLENAMEADIDFAAQLVETWRQKGKLKVDNPALITGVFRALFFLLLHKEDIGVDVFPGVMDLLLDASIERLIDK